MYKKIKVQPTTLDIYGKKIVSEGLMTSTEVNSAKTDFKQFLENCGVISDTGDNNIYLIESGKVIDSGRHEELLTKSKIYKNFYEKPTRIIFRIVLFICIAILCSR